MPAPKRIEELVENFKANFAHFQSPEYKEEDLRNNFLNPFFQELGWDMEDKSGRGALRDVRYEETIVSGAPDYGFYTGNRLRFYVEAKNPSLKVCTHKDAALQLRGYGWSAKVPRCILTDFEELSIYDTTVKPKQSDEARVARMGGACIKYTEYVERWDEIVALFSREAVMAGSLEKLEGMHSSQAIDKELLVDISRWRELLARNIANRNDVSEERLNRIVQDTIGRILFLRICEDRGIAHRDDLKKVGEGDGTYANLHKLFRKAEQRYDSDLFEVASVADLAVDDKILKEIVSELYFPESPYKFDAVPAEILGQVYEQFLGKVIRLTEGGHAKVEEKPEVRKAGGIYYTPTYIVEYIVQNTVGKLVEGKTPKKIEQLSIVDPACGSGSFLLGAYKYLADWYRDWYVADGAEKHEKAKKIYRDPDKQWQLTLDERKRILTAHIYGVDLDRQAVELAKLSLMLEALRAPEQASLFNDRMLPRLGDNVKCGNSLIGTDYFAGQAVVDPTEMARINAFDWETEFPEIFKRGGFDAALGNPPYYKVSKNDDPGLFGYLQKKYKSASYKIDLYAIFCERSLQTLRPGGLQSFIIPNSLLTGIYLNKTRDLIAAENILVELLLLQNVKVFKDAKLDSVIYLTQKGPPTKYHKIILRLTDRSLQSTPVQTTIIDQNQWENLPNHEFQITSGNLSVGIQQKMRAQEKKVGDIATIHLGLILESNDLLKDGKSKIAPDAILHGRNIGRYKPPQPKHWFNFSTDKIVGGTKKKEIYQVGPRIVLQAIRNLKLPRRLVATLVQSGTYTDGTLHNIIVRNAEYSPYYLLGILNSNLLNTFYSAAFPEHRIKGRYLESLPIVAINFSDAKARTYHDQLVKAVTQVMSLNIQINDADDSTRRASQRQIDSTDNQIDQLVYKLYGLTDEEIRIVEEGTK